MTASITLEQERFVLDTSFRVWSVIHAATPLELYPAFVMQGGVDWWEELYVRTATLDDVARYAENALVRFVDPGVEFHTLSPAAGDVLVIVTTVDDWLGGTMGLTNQKFTLVDPPPGITDDLFVQATKPLPDARNGLLWELWDSTEVTLKGSSATTTGAGEGYARRADDGDGLAATFLRRRTMQLYNLVNAAEAHAEAIQIGVRSLAVAANVTPPPFAGYEEHVYP